MNTRSNNSEGQEQVLHELEFQLESNVESDSVALSDDTLRSKIIYLFSGTVILAAWWLVYENLLTFYLLTFVYNLFNFSWNFKCFTLL